MKSEKIPLMSVIYQYLKKEDDGLDPKYQGRNLVSWRILFIEESTFVRHHVIMAHLLLTNKENIYTICYSCGNNSREVYCDDIIFPKVKISP